jgi:hypothetical protein
VSLDAVNWGAWIPTLIFIVPPVVAILGFMAGWMVGYGRGWDHARQVMLDWFEDQRR